MRISTFLKNAVIGYAMAFAFTAIMCIIVSVVTDFGEYITWQRQFAIMANACLSQGLWGLAFPCIMLFTESKKTRFKTLNSIKQHFGIDYPDEPY